MTDDEIFRKDYMTSTEICEEMGINRSTLVFAQKSGRLPSAIRVCGSHVSIWRRETVRPHLDAWKVIYRQRKNKDIQ